MQQNSIAILGKLEKLISSHLLTAPECGASEIESVISSAEAAAVAHDLKEARRTLRIIQNMLASKSAETTMDEKKVEYFEEALQLIEAASKVSLAALSTIVNDQLD